MLSEFVLVLQCSNTNTMNWCVLIRATDASCCNTTPSTSMMVYLPFIHWLDASQFSWVDLHQLITHWFRESPAFWYCHFYSVTSSVTAERENVAMNRKFDNHPSVWRSSLYTPLANSQMGPKWTTEKLVKASSFMSKKNWDCWTPNRFLSYS